MTRAKPHDDTLSAEELRATLYEIAERAEVARMAIDGLCNHVSGLSGIRKILETIHTDLFHICGGGHTIERFESLEEKAMAVAS